MVKRALPLALLVSVLLAGCGAEETTEKTETVRPVKTVTIKSETRASRKSYPAVVLPAQQAELSFRASGQIVVLPVKAATEVKEDDIIAKLDTRDFEAQVTALESQLEQAKAQLDGLTSGARAEDIASLQANITAAGQGVALISDDLAARDLKEGRLVRFHETGLDFGGYHLVYLKSTLRQRAVQAFRSWLLKSSEEFRQS